MKKLKVKWSQLVLMCFLGALSITVNAQVSYHTISDNVKTGVNGTPSSLSFNTSDIDKIRSGAQLNEKTTSAKLYLKLDLGEDFVNTSPDGEITYGVSVDVHLPGSTTGIPYTSKQLNITENIPEQMIEIDLLNEFIGASTFTDINISITSSMTDGTSTLTNNYVTANARLTATFVREYGVDVRLASSNLPQGVKLTSATSTGRIVDFNWETNSTENFPNYEIQILRLYNVDEDNASNTAVIKAEIDWNKALKVETQSSQKSIQLTIAEGTGFYVWRVRPIGNYHSGGIANVENYGVWNKSSLKQGVILDIDKNRSDVFSFIDPDQDVNWIYNRVFTEGNASATQNQGIKTSEGMSYADGLLRARQTQAYNSSNNTTLVTQTVSDYSGRPALTTLPVPVADGLTGYKVGFVKNTAGDLYTAADYDEASNIVDPEVVNQTGTAFDYYDGTNAEGVADAEGYPYKRTLFKTDGTGRVTEESGVGKMHALGTQGGTEGGGRTTRILFGTPSDEELLRIFGDEAPLAESVIKTLTIDPNNVVSVTYTSKEGKTIATALISDNVGTTSNLLPLDGSNRVALTVRNKANQNIVSNQKMISSRRIAIEKNKDVSLSYNNSVVSDMNGCAGGDCELKLRFYLNDLTRGITYVSNADVNDADVNYFNVGAQLNFTAFPDWGWDNLSGGTAFLGAITAPTVGDDFSSTFELTTGEYIITKEVFSTNDPNFVDDNMVVYSEKYVPIINALADKMNTIKNTDDYDAFKGTWMTGLKDKIDLLDVSTPALHLSTTTVIVDYLGMDVSSTYLFPADFEISGDFFEDPLEPTQDKLTLNVGGCCAVDVVVPKPEVCPSCHGKVKDDSQNIVVSTVIAQINTNISNNTPLEYGIDDIRKNADVTGRFYSNGNTWNQIYTSNEYTAISDIVADEYMSYLYRKLDEENMITGFDRANPKSYDVVTNNTEIQGVLDRFAPGFTRLSMQYMITNMLVSRYYTGQSKEDAGVNYRAKEKEDGTLDFIDINEDFTTGASRIGVTGIDDGDEFNYDCEKLFDCWVQAVDMINAFDFDDDMNIMDSFNEEQEDDTSSEEHDDDDDSKEEGGNWVVDMIADWVVSSKMRSFQDEVEVPKERLEAIVSFSNIFMECAGYYHAQILDQFTTLPADYTTESSSSPIFGGIDSDIIDDFTTNFNNGTYTATNPFVAGFGTKTPFLVIRDDDGDLLDPTQGDHILENTCGSCVDKSLYYDYVLKPEWMFKYFVYNAYSGDPENSLPHNTDNDFMPVLNQFEVEVNNCYQSIYARICNAITNPNNNESCSEEPCNYYHDSWSAGQRLYFYKQIQGARKCSESCVASPVQIADIPAVLPECSKVELAGNAAAELVEMKATCEYRIDEFKSAIINDFKSKCWEIVECAELPYQITEAQIDVMAEKVVAQCKSEVVAVETNLATYVNTPGLGGYGMDYITEFPKCQTVNCSYVDIATKSCVSTQKREITLFPECDQLLIDQINKWDFEVNVPNGNKPNCIPDGEKNWVSSASHSVCTEHINCSSVQCIEVGTAPNTTVNTYSNIKPIVGQ